MPWGYVAGAVASSFASSALSPSNSGSAAGAADPFASQRGQYQSPLSALILGTPGTPASAGSPATQGTWVPGTSGNTGDYTPGHFSGGTAAVPASAGTPGTPSKISTQGDGAKYNPQIATLANDSATIGANNATAVQAGQGTNAAQNQMIALMQGGPAADAALANSSGYQFALNQGVQAADRSAAAKGTLGSGQAMVELMQYGQGLATQTLNSTMTNLSNENTALSNSQSIGLQAMNSAESAYSNLNAAAANQYSNAYQQLAQLSGANSGQPGVAGQLQQQGQANASAFGQQIGNAVGPAISNAFSTPNPGAYNGQDVNAVGGNTSVYGNYGNNASGDAINIGYGGT